MIIVPDYRGHRIEASAVAIDGRWNAEVHIRRALSDEKPAVNPPRAQARAYGLCGR